MVLFGSLARKRSAQTTKTSKRTDEKNNHRGVEVIGNGDGCCEAARTIKGKRFLKDDVPMLPLDGCDASDCNCSYKIFGDRRTDIRRASDVAFDIASELCEQDNRSGESSGRRSDD